MKRRAFLKIVGAGVASRSVGALARETSTSRRPNVILILTDNQASWTLGCYGNPEILTPNIDRLAREGVMFTRCFSSSGVCSPTRATYLTGLLPSQHGVHCYLRANEAQIGPGAFNMIEEFTTLPQILAGLGYACGLTGKWHLGGNEKPQEGFTYWVTKPDGHTSTFYGAEVIEDGRIHKEATYLTDFWTNHGVRFIERNKDRPFFLFLPYNGPYGLGASLQRPARNRHAAYYADKKLTSFPREPAHPWLQENRRYLGDLTAMRRYAAEISGVDDGVGRVLETLDRLDLKDNTLVIFTADQGLCTGHHGMWGMADHSRPLQTYDEACHIPLIFRHPSAIPASRKSDLMVSNYDFLPTVLNYLGLRDRIPDQPRSPGRDYSAALRGRTPEWENVIFFEFENTRMVRTPQWKYTRRFPSGPDELYDLQNDAGERVNLIDRTEHANIRDQLAACLEAFFAHHANPKYDLWHGGGSKTLLLTSKQPALPGSR